MKFLPWTEKYRPKKVKDIIGQDHIKEVIEGFLKKKSMPHLLFAGPPGVGKTTMALAMAHELYGDDLTGNFLELNASDERGIDVVRGKIKDFARTLTANDVGFKIIFLDEADALTSEAQQALRRTMEVYSDITRFILSCNYSSKIIEPIQSRTAAFRFMPLTKEHVAEMVKRIEKGEKIKVSKDALDALYYISEGDLRKVINILQGAAFHSKEITADLVYKVSSRASPKEIKLILKEALFGDFKKARDKLRNVMLNYGLSGEDVIIQFYKEIQKIDELPDKKKVQLIDKIGEYNFRLVEGANEMLQVEALLAQFYAIGKER